MKHLLIIFILLTGTVYSQETPCPTSINIFAGAGLPETFHAGARFNYKQWHIDASGGTTLGGLFTINGNAAYHFGRSSNSNLCAYAPWYTSLGVSYMESESSTAFVQDVYLNGRIGRDFRICNAFSISLSLGLGVNLYHFKRDLDPGGWDFDIWVPIIPSGQLSFQYRLFPIKINKS